jgi:hypothetical protein
VAVEIVAGGKIELANAKHGRPRATIG